MLVLDSHVHLWRLADRPQAWIEPTAMAVIHRDFTLADLDVATAGLDVPQVVLVQVLNREDETEDYLRLAAGAGRVSGVVGWVDLGAADLEERVARLRALVPGAALVGIRHQALAEPDPSGWLAQREVGRGLRTLGRAGLAFELMIGAPHLPAATDVVAAHPDTMFVLDHAGKPPLALGWASEECRRWATSVARLAERENTVAKVSGLTTMLLPAPWRAAEAQWAIDHLLATFGPERLMFGSDWPNCLRAGSYRETAAALLDGVVAGLAAQERSMIVHGTAERTYRLRAGATWP